MEKNFVNTKAAQLSFHLIAYYIVWFSCIYGAAHNYLWAGLMISVVITLLQYFWQKCFRKQTDNLLIFILYLTIVGFVGDSLLVYFRVLDFASNPFTFPCSAPFMIGIWLNFSIMFYAILLWFVQRPVFLMIFSLIGFVFAYFVGSSMNAAFLLQGTKSLLVIGIMWGVLLPSSILLFDRFLTLPKES